jgi:hypothetical protein
MQTSNNNDNNNKHPPTEHPEPERSNMQHAQHSGSTPEKTNQAGVCCNCFYVFGCVLVMTAMPGFLTGKHHKLAVRMGTATADGIEELVEV